jgi:hypothetical protein
MERGFLKFTEILSCKLLPLIVKESLVLDKSWNFRGIPRSITCSLPSIILILSGNQEKPDNCEEIDRNKRRIAKRIPNNFLLFTATAFTPSVKNEKTGPEN